MERFGSLAARLLLCLMFLASGLLKVAAWPVFAGFMASKGMPVVPLFLAGAIAFELGGGLSLLLGFRARVAAWALFFYLIPVTLIFHNFWAYQGMERQDMMIQFLKNLAIMGGVLMVAVNGAGPLSLDTACSKER